MGEIKEEAHIEKIVFPFQVLFNVISFCLLKNLLQINCPRFITCTTR